MGNVDGGEEARKQENVIVPPAVDAGAKVSGIFNMKAEETPSEKQNDTANVKPAGNHTPTTINVVDQKPVVSALEEETPAEAAEKKAEVEVVADVDKQNQYTERSRKEHDHETESKVIEWDESEEKKPAGIQGRAENETTEEAAIKAVAFNKPEVKAVPEEEKEEAQDKADVKTEPEAIGNEAEEVEAKTVENDAKEQKSLQEAAEVECKDVEVVEETKTRSTSETKDQNSPSKESTKDGVNNAVVALSSARKAPVKLISFKLVRKSTSNMIHKLKHAIAKVKKSVIGKSQGLIKKTASSEK